MKHSLLHDIVSEFVLPMSLVTLAFWLITFWPFAG